MGRLVHFLVALTVAAVLPLAPTAPAEDGPLVVPGSHGGDVATWNVTSPRGSWDLTLAWSPEVTTVPDAFDVPHRVASVTATGWCFDPTWCEAWRFHLDAATHAMVASESVWSFDGPFGMLLGEFPPEDRHAVRHDDRLGGISHPLLGLQGRTLAAGDTFVDAAWPSAQGVASSRPFTALGWEEIEGVTLFRVDHGALRLWFDGVHPVPLRMEGEGLHLRDPGSVARLAAFERGAAPAEDPGYAAPDVVLSRPAPRATFGAEGPAEDVPAAFPVRDAATTVRDDPRAAAWFLENPDAVVTYAFSQVDDGEILAIVEWQDDDATLWAEVSGVVTPAGPMAAVDQTSTSTNGAPGARDALLGREFACLAAAREVVDRDAPVPSANVETGEFHFSGGAPACSASAYLDRSGVDHLVLDGGRTLAGAWAGIDPATGGVRFVTRSVSSTTLTRPSPD